LLKKTRSARIIAKIHHGVKKMNLPEYLFEKKITRKKFAEDLDMQPHYVGQIVNGKKLPSRKVMRRIEKVTDGAFPQSYWQSEDYLKFHEQNKNTRLWPSYLPCKTG